jgi:hypothetical protein
MPHRGNAKRGTPDTAETVWLARALHQPDHHDIVRPVSDVMNGGNLIPGCMSWWNVSTGRWFTSNVAATSIV